MNIDENSVQMVYGALDRVKALWRPIHTKEDVCQMFHGALDMVNAVMNKEDQSEASEIKENLVHSITTTKQLAQEMMAKEDLTQVLDNKDDKVNTLGTKESTLQMAEARENLVPILETKEDLGQILETKQDLGQRLESKEDLGQRLESKEDLGQRLENKEDLGQRLESKEDLVKALETKGDLGQRLETKEDLGQRLETKGNLGKALATKKTQMQSLDTEEGVVQGLCISEDMVETLENKECQVQMLKTTKEDQVEASENKENLIHVLKTTKQLAAEMVTIEDLIQVLDTKYDMVKTLETKESTVQMVETKENLVQRLETKEDLVQRSETKDDLGQALEVEENLVQRLETKEDLVQRSETKEDLGQALAVEENLVQRLETKEDLVQRSENKEDLGQALEVEENLVQRLETKEDLVQRSETKEDLGQALAVEENLVQRLETKEDLVQRSETKEDLGQALEVVENQLQVPGKTISQLQALNKSFGNTKKLRVDKGVLMSGCIAGNIIINSSSTEAPPKESDTTRLVSKTLKEGYNKMNFQVQAPWLPSGFVDFKDYLYNVINTSTDVLNDHGKIFARQAMILECMFDYVEGLKPTRIVLKSYEALLTSIVLIQLCRSWASNQGPAGVFDLVVFLDGRQLADNTLEELIVKKCRTEGVKDEDLLQTIKTNHNVLLILDHVVDLPPGQRTALNRFLQSTNYEHTTLIVSSQRSEFYSFAHSRNCIAHCYHVACSSPKNCLKMVYFNGLTENEEIQFIITNVSHSLQQPWLISCFIRNLKNYFCVEMLSCRTLFLLLLMHVFLREPLQKGYDRPKIYKTILKKLVRDHFERTQQKSNTLISLNGSTISSPAVSLASNLGEHLLKLQVNKSSKIDPYFHNGQASIMEFGFVKFHLHYDEETQIDQFEPVHQFLLDFFITYHVSIACRTQSDDQVLQKLDHLNCILPLHDFCSEFVCECFLVLLGNDVAKFYDVLYKNRARYSTLVGALEHLTQHKPQDDSANLWEAQRPFFEQASSP